ncbi:MAG: hypothetical protein NWF08_01310 [Candidatus Bathyarchaeota archaeon]|nr:hypothetical protein [Candidatus Bathyarchaeota archaeon]
MSQEEARIESNSFYKIRRSLRNLKYKLRISDLLSIKPSLTLISAIVISLAIFFLVGGVYNYVEIMMGRAISLIPREGGWTFIYPGSLHMQTISESIVAGFLYLLGILGLYLLLKGTRLVYKPRQAYMTLIFGLMLVLLISYYSSFLLNSKVGG